MHTDNYKIDEYQRKVMRERAKLDYDLCNNEKNENKTIFSKRIRNYLDIYLQTLNRKGVLFFGFTINFSELAGMENEAWKMIHFRVEEFISLTAKRIELCEFVYLSIEKHGDRQIQLENNNKENKKKNPIDITINEQKTLNGLPHIHGIIGVRSLIGRNDNILLEINKQYTDCYNDMLIKELKSIRQIKGYWNYVIKENNFKFHRFSQFSKFFNNETAEITDLELTFDNEINLLGSGLIENAKYNNILGIGRIKNSNKSILLYLLNLYFHIKGIVVYNNELYIRNEQSKFSWNILDKINYISVNNLMILNELKTLFPQQLNDFEISDTLLLNFESLYADIYKHNHYLPTIKLNSNVIEFADGLYFLDYNYFFDFIDNSDKLDKMNINCFKYFEKKYYYCKRTEPKAWLQAINNNFNNDLKTEEFCANLGRYFHSRQSINQKKKTICIVGSSNPGKTTLIVNIITQIIGLENMGIISNAGDTFAFEQFEDKKVIICDEFKYSTSNRSELLKIFDKKAISKKLFVNNAPILFMFNKNINNKMLEDQAFINRLIIYTFTYQVTNPNNEIKQILIDELPQIMLYCNKLFLKKTPLQNADLIFDKKERKKSAKLLLDKYVNNK